MSHLNNLERKIIPIEAIEERIAEIKRANESIVFTNGVFDIIHKGHVTLLNNAADLGSHLILGINSDDSTRTLGKGPDRPINSEFDRAYVLAGLSAVKTVVIFNESTPYELIKKIDPDVLVKGGDYSPNQTNKEAKDYIVGSDLQRASAKKTIAISLVDGYSSTAVIKKISNGQN